MSPTSVARRKRSLVNVLGLVCAVRRKASPNKYLGLFKAVHDPSPRIENMLHKPLENENVFLECMCGFPEAKQALTHAVKMLHPDHDRLRLACTTLGKCCLDLHDTDGEPICQYLALPFPYHKCDSALFPPGARCGCRQNCMSRLPEASPLLYAPDLRRRSQSAVGMLLSICKPAAIWARLLHEGQQSIAADWDDEMSKVAWNVPDGFPGRACRAIGALQVLRTLEPVVLHGSTMAHQGACSISEV